MKLYICEKPSQAADIAKVLGNARKTATHWETDGGRVTWCFGHLLELAEPEAYDARYKRWDFADLPILPERFRYIPKKTSTGQLRAIGELLRDCSSVVIATDADREGEFIAYEVLEHCHYKGGIERLWLSALDPESVRKALSRIRPGAETVALYHAASARSASDWVVGMSCTRAMTLKSGDRAAGVVSIGRVQTPTVALVVRRDREIEEFKPRDYFEIDARINAATGEMVTLSFAPKDEAKRLWTIDQAESLATFARGKPVVIERNTADKRKAPPELFSLSGLQKRANALWGWSADHTLTIAQSLYETHKATTYPRTDCAFLPAEQIPDVPIIAANLLRLEQFKHLKPAELEPRKTVFNSAKVTAHHAIIPTKIAPPISTMTSDERMAYGLIAAHYLGSLLPDYEFQSTKLSTTIKHPTGPVEFSTTGITPTRPGWKRAFGETPADEDESTPTLPAIPHGTTGLVAGTDIKAKKTQPPARYTEGTLIEDMRSVAKFITDPDKKSRLKESSGIGTEATRANILKTIRDRGYVLAKGKQLISTPKGRSMIALLERELPALADPGETAVWEEGLESIATGHLQPGQFIASIGSRVREYIGVLAKRPTVEPVGRFKMPDGKPTGQKIGTTEILDHGEFFTAAGAITGRVFKDVWGHALTPAELARLVAGQTLEIRDCRKRDGSPAEPQKIRYNATKKPYPGVEVVRTEAPAVATSVQSPRGKSGILDHGDYYTAPGYESEGRPVRFWKKMAGRIISPEELAAILASKADGVQMGGFSKADGTPFRSDPIVRYNARKKPYPGLEFDFPQKQAVGTEGRAAPAPASRIRRRAFTA